MVPYLQHTFLSLVAQPWAREKGTHMSPDTVVVKHARRHASGNHSKPLKAALPQLPALELEKKLAVMHFIPYITCQLYKAYVLLPMDRPLLLLRPALSAKSQRMSSRCSPQSGTRHTR